MRRVLALVIVFAAFVGGPMLQAVMAGGSPQQPGELIYILGHVQKPGAYAFTEIPTVEDAITMAGGPSRQANLDDIRIIRRVSGGESQTINVKMTDLLAIGDTLVVGRLAVRTERMSTQDLASAMPGAQPEHSFFVAGHVRTPNRYRFKEGMTVAEAITLAGGITERGSARGLKIRREVTDGKFAEIDVTPDDVIQPNDTIIVRLRRL